MTKEDYVSFGVAKLLILNGFEFNNKYHTYYTLGGVICNLNDSQKINIAPRVTHQMVMEWLRGTKGISIIIEFNSEKKGYRSYVYRYEYTDMCWVMKWKLITPTKCWEATELAIKYSLENLI